MTERFQEKEKEEEKRAKRPLAVCSAVGRGVGVGGLLPTRPGKMFALPLVKRWRTCMWPPDTATGFTGGGGCFPLFHFFRGEGLGPLFQGG